MNWEATERRKYNNAYGKWKWGDMCVFPKLSLSRWKCIVDVTAYTFKKWVDVGCGPGYGIAYGVRKGLDIYGSDISEALMEKYWKPQGLGSRCFAAPAHRQPFKDGEFDFTICFETMEHIPEEGVMDSLTELRRISNGVFLYTIALTNDIGPMGIKWKKSHVTVKPEDWWFERLVKTGHNVVQFAVTGMDVKDGETFLGAHRSFYVLGYFGDNKKKAVDLVDRFF